MNDKEKKAFMLGWSAGYSTACAGVDDSSQVRERDWKMVKKIEDNKYYAIHSPRCGDIGVCIGSELEHCLNEDPGCVGREITKEEFESFGDEEAIKPKNGIIKNPTTGLAEVWSNGKRVGIQG